MGNPGQRRLNDDEPKHEKAPSKSEPPAYLSELAKAEWRRMYPVLRNCGVLTVADLSGFEAYCVAFGIMQEAAERVSAGELTTTAPNGQEQPHPCVSIVKQYLLVVKAFLAEYGLTPSSRSRIIAGAPPPPGDSDAPQDQPEPLSSPEAAGGFTGLIGRQPN